MAMEHTYITEHSLIERYHQGRLPPEIEARFEEHFVDCAQCMDELEAARGFERGIKAMVAEDATRVAAAGWLAWWSRLGRLGQLGLLMAAVVIAAGLPSWWFRAETERLRVAANEALAASDSWRQQLEGERGQAAVLERQLEESESRWSLERTELEARINEALGAAERGAVRSVARLAEPLINTPVFILSALRSTGAEPAVTIELDGASEDLVLAVDIDDDARIESYRVTVNRANGERLWRRDGLLPNALEVLMVTFPTRFFSAGDYRLEVAGLTAAGDSIDLDSYGFRVVSKR